MRLTTEDLDGLVTWTLIRAAHVAERRLTRLFAEHDLSPVQFGILAHLATGQTHTSAQLAREVLTRPQSTASVIDGLVKRGLVARAGAREKGRPNPVELTSTGLELLTTVWPAVLSANQPDALDLPPDDTAELNRILHTLVRTAQTRSSKR
ncbi:MAG: MarR family winged helix-turn-helix transcriptional regulator [Nakamurella sp.]